MRLLLSLGLTLLLSFSSSALLASAVSDPDPTNQLRPFIDKVVGILTDKALQGEDKRREKRQKIMDVAHERFDFAEMSRLVLGSEWRDISDVEQKHFVDLFTKLLEHAYIGKLEGYSGQRVEFVKQRIKKNRAQVQTHVIEKDVVLPVYYIMKLESGEWMVYDVVVDGVSMIRNYKEQFKEVLRQNKYTGLIKQLEEKVAGIDGEYK